MAPEAEMVIFRGGIAVAVPTDYASQPDHVAVVEQLTATTQYAEAVRILHEHAISWLAADVLRGAPWAQRFLNTTARLALSPSAQDRRAAAAGWRALMRVIAGVPPRVGRRRAPRLTPEELAAAGQAVARCRAVVEKVWGEERPNWAPMLTRACGLTRQQEQRLRQRLRRRRIRKSSLVLALAAWQTGLSMRRLRQARPTADLLYG